MNKKLFSALMVIAAANADGFTVDANTLQPITKGYAVAMAETQNSFNAEGLARVIEFVNGSTVANAFGGWLDRETGLCFIDVEFLGLCVFTFYAGKMCFFYFNKGFRK